MRTYSKLCTLCACVIVATAAGIVCGQNGFHLVNKIEVGGEGGWDYLIADPDAARLYVSHGNHVVVIDTKADKVVGDIPANGVHGIAFDTKRGRGYISNRGDNSVTIFDLKTLKPLDSVKVGKNPDCIIYDPASDRVFAFNHSATDATAINAKDGEAAGTVELGGAPEFAASDGKGMVYVNLEDKNQVVAIDAMKLRAIAHWPVAPADGPTGMAIDPKAGRLFIAGGNKKMAVMDTKSGKVVADVPTGQGADAAGYDPELRYAFSSNGEGTLTVIHDDGKDKYSLVENVKTERGARTMAVDSKTHKVYLATAKYGDAPAATAANPRPRPVMVPNSFVILVYSR